MAVAVGLVADGLVGEPPLDPHPVAAFGAAMSRLERAVHRPDRRVGALYTLAGAVTGTTAGVLVGSTAAATYLAVAGRALVEAAEGVAEPLLLGDLAGARARLPALVGRDPEGLDAGEIARAVVESVAENTTDAVVAPALWAAVGGAPGALAYRAVNTMDAMVGHRSPRHERFGWASARLDDVANWVPARVTAALVVLARPAAAGAVWRAVRGDAPAHPSPNSGVAEAAFAAALGLSLGGVSRYGDRVELRPRLGSGRPPQPGDIAAAVQLAGEVQRRLATALAVGGALGFIMQRTAGTTVRRREATGR